MKSKRLQPEDAEEGSCFPGGRFAPCLGLAREKNNYLKHSQSKALSLCRAEYEACRFSILHFLRCCLLKFLNDGISEVASIFRGCSLYWSH